MRSILPQVLIFTFLLHALHASAAERQFYQASSPRWLEAIGTLTVPGHRFVDGDRQAHVEDCSATLIHPRIVLTAWHCLENYRDLSKEIQFELPMSEGRESRTARVVASGDHISADWALLRLAQPIEGTEPLLVANTTVEQSAWLAGYSQAGPDGSRTLSWYKDCVTRPDGRRQFASDCGASKGDSGGPLLLGKSVVGVISVGDGASLTYSVASQAFIAAVRLHAR